MVKRMRERLSPLPSPPSSPRNTHALERKSSKILSSPKKRDGSEGGAEGGSKDFDTSDYFKTKLKISNDDENEWRVGERTRRDGFETDLAEPNATTGSE